MCISKFTNEELVLELKKRNLMTNSKTNEIILSGNSQDIKIILTYGTPNIDLQCRECRETKSSENFSFYQARVDSKGYLMRSNALCNDCKNKTNEDRRKVFQNSVIPEKPNKGDSCPNCNREWEGNWHRHHVDDKFIAYICGHCNMSFSDQRNKVNLINEK